jgi:protein gp37
MGDTTGVNWSGATWNGWQGCRKISLGCKFCYMYRDKERYGQDPTVVHRSSKSTFDRPLKWQREAERGDRVGHDRLVFTCSWSDWFIEEADGPWRDDAWAIIRACPLLTFQVLTKRIGRAKDCFPSDWGGGYPNCWGGVSVEDQAAANSRIPELLRTPWVLRFLSVEPLLGLVDLRRGIYLKRDDPRPWYGEGTSLEGIGWVIVGGESGNDSGKYRARSCDLSWVRGVVEQCRAAGVPVWVKQLGTRPFHHGTVDGGAASLNLKDRHGEDWSEWPCDLRVRQIPAVMESARA